MSADGLKEEGAGFRAAPRPIEAQLRHQRPAERHRVSPRTSVS